MCNLGEFASQIIKKLSGGYKKRTSLASSIIGNPSIMFMDEPSSGVDVSNRKDFWEFLSLIRNPNRIIILTTH